MAGGGRFSHGSSSSSWLQRSINQSSIHLKQNYGTISPASFPLSWVSSFIISCFLSLFISVFLSPINPTKGVGNPNKY